MTLADKYFKHNIRQTLKYGKSDVGQLVRPRWLDGTPAHTKKIFAVNNVYDLSKEFPILTIRPTAWQSALKEVLWIYQMASNDVKELKEKLGVKYWDAWANEKGNLGTAYGKQMQYMHYYDYVGRHVNQVDKLLFDLKHQPFSRRMITNLYNHAELNDMTIEPCAMMTMWDFDGESLNMTLIQRSQDAVTASNINLVQYSLLLHMVARHAGMKPGRISHYINNFHVYDRHEEIAHELLKRESTKIPKLYIDESIDNFYDFKPEHFKLEGYEPHDQIKIEVAI